MQSCSNELDAKFSKPKISKTPKNLVASFPGLMQVFMWLINQANDREYSAFAICKQEKNLVNFVRQKVAYHLHQQHLPHFYSLGPLELSAEFPLYFHAHLSVASTPPAPVQLQEFPTVLRQ